MVWRSLILMMSMVVVAAVAGAEEGAVTAMAGETVNGSPSWEERVLHQWINRARVEPSADLAGCGSNCSPAEQASSCYTPVAPLYWSDPLGRAARFHGDSMVKMGFFSHFTPCALRSNLSSIYPGSCDGSSQCACSGAGSTDPSGRAYLFGGSYTGEIIAAGYNDPVSAFYGWLHEPVTSSAPCAYSSNGSGNTNGHRWLILKSGGPALGSGYAAGGSWGKYWITDFGRGGTASKIPSGTHYPRQGSSVEVWANWYDASPPSSARVIVDGSPRNLALERGTSTNGAWTTTLTNLDATCHRYWFEFRDSAGQTVHYPTTGSFGIGPSGSCADWSPVRSSSSPGAAHDFTADGKNDLLWRQPASGKNVWWAMSDVALVASGDLLDVAGADWSIGGAGDFSGDGKPDILWRNGTTGQNVVWVMNGTSKSSHVTLMAVPAPWEAGGVADFDADGDADIVWRNPVTGQNVLWTMNGMARASYASLLAVPGSAWKIGGTGDVTGDGKADLVWRNYTTGQNVLWVMNGAARSSYATLLSVPDPAWRIAAVADYSGDGKADVVWRNAATGENVLWRMNGAARSSYQALPPVPDPTWIIGGPR